MIIMRYDKLRWLCRLLFVLGVLGLCFTFAVPEPTVVQAQEPEGAWDLDLTGNYIINGADAHMIAEAWEVMVEEEAKDNGPCIRRSQRASVSRKL